VSFTWLALAGVAGPLMLFALIARHGPARGTSLLFVVPAVTALIGWVLIREPVGRVAVLGLVIAGSGLWLGRRRTPARIATPAPPPVAAVVGATSSAGRHGQEN
jgi:drug/metabolite transporter (DMT)-like permease